MLTARNSVHKSAAFGRNRFSHHTGRKGDSPPVVLLASCQDPARLSKDDAIDELIPVENEAQFVELNPAEASVHEKRAEKRRRQKEKRTKQNSRSDERDADALTSRTLNSSELESHEDLQIRDDVGAAQKDATGLDLGDRSKSETLGLAFVKNDPSLSSCNVSECSESLSLELDGCEEGESTKPEPLESGGLTGILPDVLDPRSSVTDSSGVETSSDADVEHHTFSTNSSASSVKDHDVVDEAYVECDPHGNLKSLQWDQNDAEFTVVAKKKKAKATKPGEEHESVSVQTSFGSASCSDEPFRQDGFPRKSNVSLASPVEPTVVRSQRGCDDVSSNSLLFLSQSQSLDIVIAQDSDRSVLMSAIAVDDNGSTYTDDNSSDMGLSQFDFDDDYLSYLSKNDSDWTVVKTVRRTKCALASSDDVAEDRKSISLEAAKCSDNTAKFSRVQPGATENAGPKSAFGGQSRNSRYVNNCEVGLKNFRLKERNLTQVGFSGNTGAHHRTLTNSRRGDGNVNTSHRNLCQSSSVNSSAGFKGISRILSTSIGTEQCDHSFDNNGPRNNTEFKHISARSADAYVEKPSFFRSNRGSPAFSHHTQAVVEKFISMGKFDVGAAARFIEAEYQRIMTKHKKNPELVIIYDSSEDV